MSCDVTVGPNGFAALLVWWNRALKERTKPDLWTGRWWAIAAAFLWSTSGFFAKAPYFSGDDWSPIRLAFWRAVFASVILLPMIRRPQWSLRLIPMVVCFVIMNYTFLTALKTTTAGNAIWLQYTAPAWVFFIGVLAFGEKVHRGDWWMLAFSCLGVGLILTCEIGAAMSSGKGNLDWILYGLVGGATFAGVVLSIRRLSDHDPAWLVGLNHVVTALVLLPFVVGGNQPWPNPTQWTMLAGFGMFQMGIPYVFFAISLKHISGHQASGITLLEPVLMPIWVFIAWQLQPKAWTVIGGGLILGGLMIQFFMTPKKVGR